MSTRACGAGAGWSWLVQGCAVYRRGPGTLLGASALLVACTAILFGIQLLARRAGGARAAAVCTGILVILALFGVVFPILIGGFMRVIHAVREGSTPRAWMVLQPFQPGHGGARLALFGLRMLALYVAFFALVFGTVGRALAGWYFSLLTAEAADAPAHAMAPLPPGSGVAFALLAVFLVFYSAALAIGTGQVALGGQRSAAAFRDAVAGAFKNVLPLLVMTVCCLIAALLAMLVFGVLAAVMLLLARMLGGDGTIAAVAVILVLEILFALALYPVVVGIQVALWHDVTQGTAAPSRMAGRTA